ncbi:bifunctional (p)ppGpp synthetase/guanosine-3',5'-bis(diphosphate) 3'-pyrophosphohydrolase [Hathewaya histolytica]|uniref:GTP diphosphokinase n=1 Tax=Hathewaya histolytica TaxID=1498 RepID=A0A4U9RTX6_HATHI|nr:bifunctional (p)ppGpp synthetase/guanosine-3',5'-bis(diphosphate) 3'-pyrophosphohydrolase [Hathewaya histolytica]VTQ92450.1 GTP pyrophosphokinase [Hathewaya histolytica]
MIEKLLNKIDENNHNVDKEIVLKAYNLAYEAHKEQMRESGEPYIIHPIEVASIIADLGMDTSTIVAGLLHDIIEDTEYTYDDLSNIFGEEIANLVEGVTKLGKIKYKSKEEQQADNVRKMLLAMAKDIRVILIKLADRLHNMRTLKYMPIFKQKEKAKETLDIYAPLAHRLGISKIKWELEDLALRYMNPNLYYTLVKDIAQKRTEREAQINNIIENLSDKLTKAGIESEIEGRPKHFYSIYNKMRNKNKNLDQIFDLTAVRILVSTVVDCYSALGIVHTLYKPMPGRFKDYIAMPKPNMYQSLHSTVIGPKGKPFEIQIRTYDMHKTAEYGIAAHWKYKEGHEEEDDLESKLYWLRDIIEWEGETSDPEEFMEAFKIDLFSDEIFVFTPKGKVISLPRNSTPIDFAYRIHTDIGNKCVGSKVNGKMIPLDYKLQTGEIVEVITSSNSKGPNIHWLSIANSNHAKSKIKSFFNKLKREENIERGKELLEKDTKKQGCNFSEIAEGEKLEKIFKRYNLRTLEDLYSVVGAGIVASSNIVSRLLDGYKKEDISTSIIEDKIRHRKDTDRNEKDSMPELILKNTDNLMARFAKCCNPVPGDDIIGYVTKGRGISVHRKDCKNVENLVKEEKEKIIEITWENIKGSEFICELCIKCNDREGMIADVVQLLTQNKIYMCSINGNSYDSGFALINLKVKIKTIETLKELKKKFRKLDGVIEINRVNG